MRTVSPNLLTEPVVGAVVVTAPDVVDASAAPDKRPLASTEARYLDVSDSLSEVVFQTDAEGRWTFLNQAWTELTGFEPAECLGRPFLDFVHPDERAATLQLFEAVVSGAADHCHHTTRYVTADGGFRWVELHARLMFDDDGQLVGNSGTMIDISELRRAEEALRESEARRRQVLEALLRAEHEERARIATDLHDDTIQVMAAVLMTLDRIARTGGETAADERLRRARDMLEAAVERARHLTFLLRPPLLSSQGLVPALEDLAAQTRADADIDVAVQADVRRYPLAIEDLAYRTVQEAVVNAKKHSGARRIEVEVSDASGDLCGVVRDDGRGFDVERMLGQTHRPLHLGLSALMERVRLAGGDVRVRSEPGHGTTLRFRVPAAA